MKKFQKCSAETLIWMKKLQLRTTAYEGIRIIPNSISGLGGKIRGLWKKRVEKKPHQNVYEVIS